MFILGPGTILGLYLYIFRSKYNLNALSHDCAIGLIEKVLAQGVKVAEVGNYGNLSSSRTHVNKY